MASATTHAQEYGPGFATHVVDVEVDPETGKVTILRYTAAQDVGKAVHPSYVEGQVQGGVAQFISHWREARHFRAFVSDDFVELVHRRSPGILKKRKML